MVGRMRDRIRRKVLREQGFWGERAEDLCESSNDGRAVDMICLVLDEMIHLFLPNLMI